MIEQILQNDVPILHSFNGLKYDTVILRHLFFENLIEPNLLSFGSWVHVDVMMVAYAIRTFATDAINFHVNEKGKFSMKQEHLAAANHINPGTAHTAVDDSITLLKLADLFEERCPEIYYTAVACGNKSRVLHRLQNEAFFCHANQWSARALGFIMQNNIKSMANDLFFFNLSYDPEDYLNMSASKLAQLLGRKNSAPFVRLGANHIPILLSGPRFCEKINISNAEASRKSEMIKEHPRFLTEFNEALQIRGNPWNNDAFIGFPEMEIYSKGFPSNEDKRIAKEFHDASYQQKLQIITHLKDTRLKKFAQRLLVLEHSGQCSKSLQRKYHHFSQLRLLQENAVVPNLTLAGAIDEVDQAIARGFQNQAIVNKINSYLKQHMAKLEK
jgi:exodeoxyribonuclease-1